MLCGCMSVFHGVKHQTECAFILRLKKRTRKAFGMRKKEKDNDSTGSPEREGGVSNFNSLLSPKQQLVNKNTVWCDFNSYQSQKKTNGAANGFYGEIDWERYNSPEVDDEGYSIRPDEEEEAADILITFI
ncbi:unnamed protein product [Merluccius merluccius]